MLLQGLPWRDTPRTRTCGIALGPGRIQGSGAPQFTDVANL